MRPMATIDGQGASPVLQAQRNFRTLLDAMARPGTMHHVFHETAPDPLHPATAAILSTLCDHDTPIWLGPETRTAESDNWIAFQTGAPIVSESRSAHFAILQSALPTLDLSDFAAGDPDYPDRSATLILQVNAIIPGDGPVLTGPGIKDQARLSPAPLPANFWDAARANHARYPLGVDFIFAAADRIAALPRSTTIGEN